MIYRIYQSLTFSKPSLLGNGFASEHRRTCKTDFGGQYRGHFYTSMTSMLPCLFHTVKVNSDISHRFMNTFTQNVDSHSLEECDTHFPA
jgi:hypothetical protein